LQNARGWEGWFTPADSGAQKPKSGGKPPFPTTSMLRVRDTLRLEVFMEIQSVPIAKTEMLIRKPVSEVFEAFVNPAPPSLPGSGSPKAAVGYKQVNKSAGIGKCTISL